MSIFTARYINLDTKDFFRASEQPITDAIKGKVVKAFKIVDARGDDWIDIEFEDGSTLHLRYDWIYEWAMEEK